MSVLGLGLAACPQPDLGVAPFLCNPGEPQCPSGYTCVKQGSVSRCIKEGLELLPDQRVDSPAADVISTVDWPQLPDHHQADKPVVNVDGPPKPDLSPPDGGGLFCATNTECVNQDPTAPCCCFGLCLPLCPMTLCF